MFEIFNNKINEFCKDSKHPKKTFHLTTKQRCTFYNYIKNSDVKSIKEIIKFDLLFNRVYYEYNLSNSHPTLEVKNNNHYYYSILKGIELCSNVEGNDIDKLFIFKLLFYKFCAGYNKNNHKKYYEREGISKEECFEECGYCGECDICLEDLCVDEMDEFKNNISDQILTVIKKIYNNVYLLKIVLDVFDDLYINNYNDKKTYTNYFHNNKTIYYSEYNKKDVINYIIRKSEKKIVDNIKLYFLKNKYSFNLIFFSRNKLFPEDIEKEIKEITSY